MKRLLTILILLLGFTTAHAQVELLPDTDRGSNVYTQINEHSFAAGFQFSGITAGTTYQNLRGEEGIFVDARLTPTIANAFGLEVIGGVGGSAGYLMSHSKPKTNWSAIYGLRYKSIELTQSHIFHYGKDVFVPITLRWYMD